jgi:hypothetical protein
LKVLALRHHGERRTGTKNGSALSDQHHEDFCMNQTTLAALIDGFVAADRPALLGASALSRLAYSRTALRPSGRGHHARRGSMRRLLI